MKSTYTIVLSLLIMCGVFGADEDEVKSVSVMEGDSVTLNPDLTQIQGMVLLLWWFGEKGFTIAQIDGKDIVYEDYEVFRGRLQLIQTGSLTITNVRTNHSGLYKAEISHKSGTLYIKFRVTVYESPSVITGAEAEMKSMSVKEGDPVTLHVPQIQGDELIVWRFGDEGKLIAKHDLETKSSPLYYETDERYRERLKLDQTGSLTITNTRTTDSGHYKVKISSNKQTLYKRFTVTVSEPGLSPAAVAGIVVAGIVVVVLLVIAAATGVIYHQRKIAEVPEIVSGVEGEEVKLNTGVTKIQTSDLIEWQCGNEDDLITQIKGGTVDITSYEDVLHGVFRDRLKLDMKTGSLTITNPRIEHTGPYKLLINNKCKKKFIVYIRGKTLIKEENDSVTLETKTEIQNGDEIRWMFGDKDTLIAEIKVETREMTTYEGPDGRFRDRLELVEANGSLTIKNITADHAGLYKLLILSSGSTLCSKFFIYVGEFTESE
uniref:Immunoglobulin domain-containing protein n=1 Tax=Cyprinus carpio TaxID=7962 RepID=A0A8C2C4Q6_CYPCA